MGHRDWPDDWKVGNGAAWGRLRAALIDNRGPGRCLAHQHHQVIMRVLAAAIVGGGLAALSTPALADPCEAPLPTPGTVFQGRVEYVGDGDSLCVKTASGLVEVRLADFNAPELREPNGRAAQETLRRLSMGQKASCRAGRRSYDRVVAHCTIRRVRIGDMKRTAGVNEGGR